MRNKFTVLVLLLSLQFVALVVHAEGGSLQDINSILNDSATTTERKPASEAKAIVITVRDKNAKVRNPIKMNPLKSEDEMEFKEDPYR